MVTIHKFTKDLDYITSLNLTLSNSNGMTISHYACANVSAMNTISFVIEGMETFIPNLEEVDFCVVIRKKVDLTATGPNCEIKQDTGNDNGKYNYRNSVPARPLDLPPDFKEICKL